MSPVLSALRTSTKEKHRILDASMPLANPEADWFDYIDHLNILATWLIPLEHWLAKHCDGPQGEQAPAFIRYSDLIALDLAQADALPANRCFDIASWPKQENSAYRWGISYVIEGSQLGGEFLYKRLSARLAPRKLGYLQGKQSGRWPAFLQALATYVVTPMDIDSACAGAVDAFDALLKQLPVREQL
ncbi:MAG: heme oxygenase [Gammaproteobacteria bacterium]|nr:MAG: heme oxygenase [Gammaproteobacteria bacterium]